MRILTYSILCLCAAVPANADIIQDLLFSNKKYAQNLEVQAFIVTRTDLRKYIADDFPAWKTSGKAQLQKAPLATPNYLVVRVRNNGRLSASGTLEVKVNGRIGRVVAVGAGNTHWHEWFLPFEYWYWSPTDPEIPEITTRWTKILVK